MINTKYIDQFFVRQFADNDCGLACLQMILNYAGNGDKNTCLAEPLPDKENGLTLLQLRELAKKAGLKARCVELEMDWMRTNTVPCILHTVKEGIGNHFQVCFGVQKKGTHYEYLLADPAGKVYFLEESLLNRQWQSKAALYFDDLVVPAKFHYKSSWRHLFSMALFPRALGISIPVLNLCSVVLGIAISWVLQRSIEDPLAGKKESLIVAIIVLLFVITIFKSVTSYLKQRILISINSKINGHLVKCFSEHVAHRLSSYSKLYPEKFIKSQMTEIQKIQNACSVFVSIILSDGSVVIIACSGLLYSSLFSGLVNFTYLLILGLITFKRQKGLSVDYSDLNELLSSVERSLLTYANSRSRNLAVQPDQDYLPLYNGPHDRYLRNARAMAVRINEINFWYECIGTINVILVFIKGIIELQRQNISNGTFILWVVLSYFISSMMPKICNAFYVLADGAEAARRYRRTIQDIS